MNSLLIPDKNISVEYPSYWDELRGKNDALRIGEIMFLVFTKQIEPLGGKKLAIDYFLNRKNDVKKPVAGASAWDYWANESRLAETMDWLFEERSIKAEDGEVIQFEINPKLTRQHIPKIRFGLKVFYGPGDILSDLSFIEFKECMTCIEQFVSTGEIEWLDKLAAVMYSPRVSFWRIRKFLGWNKDRLRQRFSFSRLDRSTKILSHASAGFRFWCFLLFVGCMNYIREEPVSIDGKEYSLSCMFGGGGHGKDDTGLTGVMFSMAESGVFGNLEETSHANYYDVALRLYQIHRQSEEIRSKK